MRNRTRVGRESRNKIHPVYATVANTRSSEVCDNVKLKEYRGSMPSNRVRSRSRLIMNGKIHFAAEIILGKRRRSNVRISTE